MDTLKWKACSRRPGEVSMNGRGMAPPTLLTTRSSRPKASRARSTRPATASRSLRSAGTATARRPAASTSSGHLRRAARRSGPRSPRRRRPGPGRPRVAAPMPATGTGDDGHLVGHRKRSRIMRPLPLCPATVLPARRGRCHALPIGGRSGRWYTVGDGQSARSATATMWVGRTRTSSSPGTPLRAPVLLGPRPGPCSGRR